MKTRPVPPELCRICKEPREGKGAKGMCNRCYVASWRNGEEPTPERKKLEAGEWKNLQAHVELDMAAAAQRAARKAGQTLPAWLRDAIREKLERG